MAPTRPAARPATGRELAPLQIALVASEATPFAKTGGLADVVSALGRALHRRGHDVRIVLPRYGTLLTDAPVEPLPGAADLRLDVPGRTLSVALRRTTLPDSERTGGRSLAVHLVDCPELFHRDGYYTQDEDEPVRWATFCRAAIESFQQTGWAPDVMHCNDWHTGLLPLLLRTRYAWDELFARTRTLLSLHNIGYQGVFGADAVDRIGMADLRARFHQEHLAQGRVNFLETGIIWASRLSTVSETYAREIQDSEHGMGLEGLLRERADHLDGIVNGVDAGEWNPRTDERIPATYDANDLSGKARCKAALLERMGLAAGSGSPGPMVLGIISRFAGQKGLDLLPEILPRIVENEDVRLVVLGSGEERQERWFQSLRDAFPTKVAVYFGYHDGLAHWIEAGADAFLMPSRYEPCGLNQMYSLRYGTVPIVRHTGGLADTVERWDPEQRAGTGFVFYDYSSEALYHTLLHALDVWRDRAAWATLVRNGMARDFSWERQSALYVDLYRKIASE